MIEELIVCDDSRIPVVWLITHEEGRAESEITMHAKRSGGEAWVWSLTSNNGLPGWEAPKGTPRNKKKCPFPEDESSSPEGAVKCIIDYAHDLEEKVETDEVENSRVIAIFRDPHVFINENMSFVRMLRDACRELKDTEALIVCLSPVDKLPIDLRTDVAVISPGLPTKETIRKVMKTQLEEDYERSLDSLEDLTDACVGLTLNQAADALAKSITQFDEVNIKFISGIKTEAISSVPGLTYIGEVPSMDNVGGLEDFKDWLEERRKGFTQEAADENLPIPRGVLCIGVSGCGKSLVAKAASSFYGMPLVCLNPPDLKGGIVGETEGNMRHVRESIESLGNCIVWDTELELETGDKISVGLAHQDIRLPVKIKGFSVDTGEEILLEMTDIIKRPAKLREIITIETESGKKIQVTSNHKFLVKTDDGSTLWKKAKDLTEEDDLIETI